MRFIYLTILSLTKISFDLRARIITQYLMTQRKSAVNHSTRKDIQAKLGQFFSHYSNVVPERFLNAVPPTQIACDFQPLICKMSKQNLDISSNSFVPISLLGKLVVVRKIDVLNFKAGYLKQNFRLDLLSL